MNVDTSVNAPHPLLDYTERYNREVVLRNKKHHDDLVSKEHYYKFQLLKLQEERRIERNQENKRIAEELNIYNIRKRHHDYESYRYLFYVGTKVDTYI